MPNARLRPSWYSRIVWSGRGIGEKLLCHISRAVAPLPAAFNRALTIHKLPTTSGKQYQVRHRVTLGALLMC